ncbi:MAG: protein-L-isoaspartate(D-aspartate) O-methyltransferase [Actinomycetota bacterium]|jgi:protein-L-isoaspartate(D-aspartate) O-methyltransferase
MVDEISASIADVRVLDAMRRVPRHRFVERFIGGPLGGPAWTLDTMRDYVMDDDADDETLAVAHEAMRALPAPGSTRMDITTSVSAPKLVASMLDLLELEPGMRVLEIGAGSGYNAALIADLVGDPSLVTTIDFDSTLIEPARGRLAALGLDAIEVVDGDGDHGVAARAPFDRVIGTVGCTDLSPSWFEQLMPDGSMLVPVHHGAAHPVVRAMADRSSRLVGPAGFVKVQGRQDQPTWWRSTPGSWREDAERVVGSATKLSPGDAWDASLYVCLRDPRGCWTTPTLLDDEGAGAAVKDGQLVVNGDGALADRLLSLLDDWESLGRPSVAHYAAMWTPRDGEDHIDSVAGPWCIPRLHHTETVTLNPT